MKKTLMSFFAGVLICALCVGCNELKQDPEPQGVDVPFTEYPFMDTEVPVEEISDFRYNSSYFATPWGEGKSKIFIINSDEELKKYTEGDCPFIIDYSKQTLLLACGHTATQIASESVKSLQKLSGNKYKLDVEVVMTFLTVPDAWFILLIIDKLGENSTVELTTNLQE